MKRKVKKEIRQGNGDGFGIGSLGSKIHPDVRRVIASIASFIGAVLFVLSFIGKGGMAGGYIFRALDFLLGRGYFFAPLTCILLGFSFILSSTKKYLRVSVLGGMLFLLTSLSLLEVLVGKNAGGILGGIVSKPLLNFFDFWGGLAIALGVWIISLLLLLNVPFWNRFKSVEKEELQDDSAGVAAAIGEGVKGVIDNINSSVNSAIEKATAREPAPDVRTVAVSPGTKLVANDASREESLPLRKLEKRFAYKRPPAELLQGDRGTPLSGDIRANSNIIKRTLQNFGVEVEMAEVSIGPTVTQYTLKPAEGIKLSRITALNNDLSLALAAHPIRIEAPIPGRSLVGIEVPNRSIATVGLRSLLQDKFFQDSLNPLFIALGRDVTGSPVFADLTRMPHLLISGATGTGKSVCIHTILSSFLYRNPPEVLRFILVDPKRVELSVYNDIPHLLTPVIIDPKKTIQSLRWAAKEMDRRYDLLSAVNARDIVSYNATVMKSGGEGLLSYIVIIIDELADLMALYPREVEASIIRLAQMARAVGIHLIVSTQRPSVEVITGLIKANITSRIAFQVASQVDSRTVLDMAGAEKLLGNGDMLFLAGDTAKPRRIQGAFISEQEVKRVVDFLREESEAPEYDEGIWETRVEEDELEESYTGDDPLYAEAKGLVIQAGKASASYLQRRLRVGYARAARLLDLLETDGVIGPGDGAKPRDVFIKPDRDQNSAGETTIEA